MEPPNSFYITLPSNVKSPSYHENKTSHFITYLPRSLQVRNFEVALINMAYPFSFDNIYYPLNKIIFETDIGLPTHTEKSRSIQPMFYKSIDEVINAINQQKPSAFKGELAFEKIGRKLAKVVLFEGEGLRLHPTLAQMLGFTTHRWEAVNIFQSVLVTSLDEETDSEGGETKRKKREDRLRFKAVRPGDINSLHYNFFIYSSICKESLVGNDYYPLLRTVTVQGEEGQYIDKTFENAQYIKLASDFLERIDIRITNDQGELVKFAYGKVILTLHFRKKPSYM